MMRFLLNLPYHAGDEARCYPINTSVILLSTRTGYSTDPCVSGSRLRGLSRIALIWTNRPVKQGTRDF